MNSEFRTNLPPVFVTRSQFEEVMKDLGFAFVRSSAQHEFWQRNGAREVECVVVPTPEASPSRTERVYRRDHVADFLTRFGRSIMIFPARTNGESNADIANALAEDMNALGDTLHRVIGRWHGKARKQAAE